MPNDVSLRNMKRAYLLKKHVVFRKKNKRKVVQGLKGWRVRGTGQSREREVLWVMLTQVCKEILKSTANHEAGELYLNIV